MSYRPTLREFIGQSRILRQALAIITLGIWSILLRGPYGCGKTELAHILAVEGTKYCETRTRILSYLEPHDRAAEVPFEDNMTYTVIVDECHLRTSYEWLYGAMEVNNYILCSNMAANLPEPFISRCFPLRAKSGKPSRLREQRRADRHGGAVCARCRGCRTEYSSRADILLRHHFCRCTS